VFDELIDPDAFRDLPLDVPVTVNNNGVPIGTAVVSEAAHGLMVDIKLDVERSEIARQIQEHVIPRMSFDFT
jgi:phage head maturation protease